MRETLEDKLRKLINTELPYYTRQEVADILRREADKLAINKGV